MVKASRDARCRRQEAGCRRQDAGDRMQETGCRGGYSKIIVSKRLFRLQL